MSASISHYVENRQGAAVENVVHKNSPLEVNSDCLLNAGSMESSQITPKKQQSSSTGFQNAVTKVDFWAFKNEMLDSTAKIFLALL